MASYNIKKNKHYSSFRLERLIPYVGRKTLKWKFCFDADCNYYKDVLEITDFKRATQLQTQINKLCGVSFGMHHRNSIRIGWTASDQHNLITLFVYWYDKGVRGQRELCNIIANKHYIVTMDMRLNDIVIKVDDNRNVYGTETIQIKRKWFGYYLFPYFGGKEPAPHNMTVYLSRDEEIYD